MYSINIVPSLSANAFIFLGKNKLFPPLYNRRHNFPLSPSDTTFAASFLKDNLLIFIQVNYRTCRYPDIGGAGVQLCHFTSESNLSISNIRSQSSVNGFEARALIGMP
ncbi:hypothetical protein CDAR_206431 [Caerostris darwini]|uniref:Uncharacterized protein n=1 Tax=Caerostris darwini TaxID=1538125 RepID=A0AAV4PWP2_9ARAC|nr:hypothetical protein CDAR_206431 [Caerostris darwini]